MSKKQFQETKIDSDRLRGLSRRCTEFRMIPNTKMREGCMRDIDHKEKHQGPTGEEW